MNRAWNSTHTHTPHPWLQRAKVRTEQHTEPRCHMWKKTALIKIAAGNRDFTFMGTKSHKSSSAAPPLYHLNLTQEE